MSQRVSIKAPGRQRGITVVEILISLMLGLLVVAAVLQLFVSTKVTYNVQETFARLQESGRFATHLLESEVRMAGHTGCSSRITFYESNLNSAASFPYRISNGGNNLGVEGFEANGTGVGDDFAISTFVPVTSGSGWTPALPAEGLNRAVPGSDAIVVRYLSPSSARLTTSNSATSLVVESTTALVTDDVAAVTDCLKASLYQVTGVSGTGSNPRTLTHDGGGSAPGNAVAAWGLPQQQYSAGAEVAALQTVFLYIGRNPRNEPSLYRRRLVNGTLSLAEELVEGIESLQLSYGEDTDGDLSADVYSTADTVSDWGAVVSVRAAFLVRSPGATAGETDSGTYTLLGAQIDPLDDRRLRRVFTTTISLRNRLL